MSSVEDLKHESPQRRAMAYWQLESSREPETFTLLLEGLLTEPNDHVWEMALVAMATGRLAQLDEALLALPEWPFDSFRTYALVSQGKGNRFLSIEPHLENWLSASHDPIRVIAAADYCLNCMLKVPLALEGLEKLSSVGFTVRDEVPHSCAELRSVSSAKKYAKQLERKIRASL